MGKTKKLERQNTVQITVENQNQLEEQLQRQGQLGDLREEQQDPRQLYLEQTANLQDTAQLGKTSFKANTLEKKERNQKIKAAKKLTDKATAYTLELYSTLAQMREDQEDLEEFGVEPDAVELLQRLEQYRFHPQMYLTGEIRQHFREYVSLIRDYDCLKEMEGVDEARLEALEPVISGLRIRLKVFCEQNRISLDGRILGEKEEAASLTNQEIEDWYDKVQAYTEHQRIITPDEPPADPEQTEEAYREVKEQLEQAEADGEADPELIANLEETEQILKAQTLINEQKKELEEEETPELLEELEETEEELLMLQQRRGREEAGRAQANGNQPPLKRTREEAISTYSDQLSMQSRELLKDMNRDLRAAGMGQVADAVELYVKGTRYLVGYTEEKSRLKKAMAAVKKAMGQEGLTQEAYRALESIQNYFSQMTNGTLGEITEENVPEGHYFDYSKEEVKESGRPIGGKKRNAALRTFSYWSDQKDAPLFAHEPTVNDLKQRLVSNCYMVASTAGVVNIEPALLKNCIHDNMDGTVTVRLFEEEKVSRETQQPDAIPTYEWRPVYVKVSKEVPRIAGADALSAGALWMQMIEKACAYRGRLGAKGYRSLWYGEGGGFLERLLGVYREDVSGKSDDELFAGICNAAKEKFVYNAGSRADVGGSDGLNAGHAYTVMGAKEENGQRYVLLRNPYSTYSLQYKENGEKKKSGGLLMDISSDETYGQFYIKFEDFRKDFDIITRTDLKKAKARDQNLR